MHKHAFHVLTCCCALIVAVASPGQSAGQSLGPADDAPFTVPWTWEEVINLKTKGGVGQTPLTDFERKWTSPGLDRTEFEALLDEIGVPQTDALRPELMTLWGGHRARMVSLHSSTARALWETAERMGPEWERDRWSKALMALSASQGRRMAEAALAAIDDVRGLLAEVVGRLPPEQTDRAELAQFVMGRTLDELMREDAIDAPPRIGGARADLWRLVQQASPDLTREQEALVHETLRRLFAATDGPRRSLVHESHRTRRIGYYIRVPDEQRLREVRAELRSPKSQQSLEAIRDAIQQAVAELDVIIGPEASARLRALLDADSSTQSHLPIATPDAAFPDPAQGELKCQLLAIDPPELPQDRADLLAGMMETYCVELSRMNAELRSIEWTLGVLDATWADEPVQRQSLLDRRRALLAERHRVNDELRQGLEAALDAVQLRELKRRGL